MRILSLCWGMVAIAICGLAWSQTDDPGADCIDHAEEWFELPAGLLRAIRLAEGGWDGLWQPNTDGTHDLGRAQVNTTWMRTLVGVDANDVADDACLNAWVAGHIFASEIDSSKHGVWAAVGNYHSRTGRHHWRYRPRVLEVWLKLLVADSTAENLESRLNSRGTAR